MQDRKDLNPEDILGYVGPQRFTGLELKSDAQGNISKRPHALSMSERQKEDLLELGRKRFNRTIGPKGGLNLANKK